MPKSKPKKPALAKKLSPMDQMIAQCVKNAQARKKSGQTDREWREQYSQTLKVDKEGEVPLSATPFEGVAFKRKREEEN